MKIAFFGGEPLGPTALKKMADNDLLPQLVVCNPDRLVGRKQTLTAPPTKQLAKSLGVEVFQPANYKSQAELAPLLDQDWDLFVVVAYNFILPGWLLDLPKQGTINLHPSLLPRLRGASPIRTAIKDDLPDDVGVTVMLMDEQMDHGPILDQLFVDLPDWPMAGPNLDQLLAEAGAELLVETIPRWIAGAVWPQTQNHDAATYSERFNKADSEIVLDPKSLPAGPEAIKIWHKICAFAGIGETYFIHQDKRVKITEASLDNQQKLHIYKVIPAGKSEINYADYLKSA